MQPVFPMVQSPKLGMEKEIKEMNHADFVDLFSKPHRVERFDVFQCDNFDLPAILSKFAANILISKQQPLCITSDSTIFLNTQKETQTRKNHTNISLYLPMDISEIAKKLDIKPPSFKPIIRKAAELRRYADTQFDSSVIGVGEICKAVICLEIAAEGMDVMIDRATAIKLSGMSERAYIRSFISMQNAIGIKNKIDIRELAIRFGCVRIIPFVTRGLSLYKDRFLASLPASRKASTDFTRPVLTAVAFYLCSKKHKLNVDKIKLIELCGTSESEFASVSTSMNDLCFDVFGTSKEKKDPREVKGNRDLLDVLPDKRRAEDGGCSDEEEPSAYKRRKSLENNAYTEWKSTVLSSNQQTKAKDPKRTKQARLDFFKKTPEPQLETS